MPKEVSKSSQHLVRLMLDREIRRDKTPFADIDVRHLKDKVRTQKMLALLKTKTADTNLLREQLRV